MGDVEKLGSTTGQEEKLRSDFMRLLLWWHSGAGIKGPGPIGRLLFLVRARRGFAKLQKASEDGSLDVYQATELLASYTRAGRPLGTKMVGLGRPLGTKMVGLHRWIKNTPLGEPYERAVVQRAYDARVEMNKALKDGDHRLARTIWWRYHLIDLWATLLAKLPMSVISGLFKLVLGTPNQTIEK